MWRYFVGAAGALLLAVAGMFLFRGSASRPLLPAAAPAATGAAAEGQQDDPLPEAPAANEKTREQKRFDRIDKDKNDSISRDEYFALRHRLFAKLDTDRNGQLSFEEWAVKGIQRFTTADKDKNGTLTRAEFATTAIKRKNPSRPRCECAKPAAAAQAQAPAHDDDEE